MLKVTRTLNNMFLVDIFCSCGEIATLVDIRQLHRILKDSNKNYTTEYLLSLETGKTFTL